MCCFSFISVENTSFGRNCKCKALVNVVPSGHLPVSSKDVFFVDGLSIANFKSLRRWISTMARVKIITCCSCVRFFSTTVTKPFETALTKTFCTTSDGITSSFATHTVWIKNCCVFNLVSLQASSCLETSSCDLVSLACASNANFKVTCTFLVFAVSSSCFYEYKYKLPVQ